MSLDLERHLVFVCLPPPLACYLLTGFAISMAPITIIR